MINDVRITFFEEKSRKSLEVNKKVVPLQPQKRNKLYFNNAQMAESVDALVSNTSGFTSIPVRPRVWVQRKREFQFAKQNICPDGGIGRRAGLKHQWIHFHPGSTPGLGTSRRKFQNFLLFLFLKTRKFQTKLLHLQNTSV